MKELQNAVNKILRTIRCRDKFMRNTTIRRDLNVITLNETIAQHAIKFYNKLNHLDNEVRASIPDYDPVFNRNCRRPRGTLLLSY